MSLTMPNATSGQDNLALQERPFSGPPQGFALINSPWERGRLARDWNAWSEQDSLVSRKIRLRLSLQNGFVLTKHTVFFRCSPWHLVPGSGLMAGDRSRILILPRQ